MANRRSDPRDQIMQFRVTRSEKRTIAALAHAAGMTVPDYVRSRLVTDTPAEQAKVMATYSNLAASLAGLEDAVAEARSVLTNDKENP